MYDLCVIGGGASGMFASVLALKAGLKVCLIECNDRIGKKLLATGNGKCNLSNVDIRTDFYNTDKIANILSKFGSRECISVFNNLGLYIRQKSGRIYPFCEMSSAVLNVLMNNLKGTDLRLSTICNEIKKMPYGYDVITNKGTFKSVNVCLATGSNASFGRNS